MRFMRIRRWYAWLRWFLHGRRNPHIHPAYYEWLDSEELD